MFATNLSGDRVAHDGDGVASMTSKILWRLHVSNQVGSVVTNKVTTDPSWFVSLRSLHSQGIQSRAHAEEKLDTSACRMFFVSCCFIIFMVIILCCQALAALTCLHMSRSTLAGKKKGFEIWNSA